MARPQSNIVEYFPHFISDGKKMALIEGKFGNDGYAVWFKILEALARTDYHFLDLRDDIDLMYLATKCRVSEERLTEIIEYLVRLKAISSEGWSHRIIWCEKFIESINDAYRKRGNKPETLDSILRNLGCLRRNNDGLSRSNNGQTDDKGGENPQSKVKESKVKESKENSIVDREQEFAPEAEANLNYSFEDFWNDYDKKVGPVEKIKKKWIKLSDRDRENARQFIPLYKLAQPEKRFRKNPEVFLNQKGWNDEIIPRAGSSQQMPVNGNARNIMQKLILNKYGEQGLS